MANQSELVKKEIETLLEKIGVKSSVELGESESGFTVVLDAGEDNALLIGKHGNTLAALELVSTLITTNKLGEFKRVTLEIGSYREEREQYLRELVDKLKSEVVDSGYEKPVRGLKPWERRFVHMYLQDDSEVVTESVGEDRDRTLVIKKK
jgi:spoIIIJ-associated protein